MRVTAHEHEPWLEAEGYEGLGLGRLGGLVDHEHLARVRVKARARARVRVMARVRVRVDHEHLDGRHASHQVAARYLATGRGRGRGRGSGVGRLGVRGRRQQPETVRVQKPRRYLPYISHASTLYLSCISTISPLHLPP